LADAGSLWEKVLSDLWSLLDCYSDSAQPVEPH
jgi:hypothetical protein